MSRLLILSCSQHKRSDPGLLPAIERYDGPAFRVLRRFLREEPSDPLDIHILSAKFGLIPCNQPIPDYDQRMTLTRARELQPYVVAELRHSLNTRTYKELFIGMGRDYLRVLDGYDTLVPSGLTVKITKGTLGKKIAELHDWLYGGPPMSGYSPLTQAQEDKPRIRGIKVELAPEQVLEVAREALAAGRGNPTGYQSWYVLVDGQRVAPKWLVGQLTGLPVSTYHTDQARRTLQRLGIPVYRG